jgi:hypothetical protein
MSSPAIASAAPAPVVPERRPGHRAAARYGKLKPVSSVITLPWGAWPVGE